MDNQETFPIMKASWHGHDIFTIRFSGTGFNFKRFLETLVEDFQEPKFGYNGEQWDEEEVRE